MYFRIESPSSLWALEAVSLKVQTTEGSMLQRPLDHTNLKDCHEHFTKDKSEESAY